MNTFIIAEIGINHNGDIKIAKKLIDEVGLSLAPGCAFGQDCRGWMRLCFAVSEEKLTLALDRLEKLIG